MKTVAIVGGGFSGSVLAASLLEGISPIRVLLFDRTGAFGAGVAYATDEPFHLLNVPAAKMSAFEDRPDHFSEWLKRRGFDEGDGFVARSLYRRYLGDILAQTPRNAGSELSLISEEIIDLEGAFQLRTDVGKRYSADAVALATGYLSIGASGFEGLSRPFAPDTWPKGDVREALIVGSGLTALDAALSVFDRYPSAHVTLVSRHGLVPKPFRVSTKTHALSSPPPTTIREIVRWLRGEISMAGDWAPVFDAMRPRWEGVWQSLSERERARFKGRLLRFFDCHRHRLPPASHERLATFWDSGALSHRCGTVVGASDQGAVLDNGLELRADLILDASGFSTDWRRSDHPLTRSLLDAGRVQPGPSGQGIKADEWGGVGEGLFALGPPLRGGRGETTAVHEIRGQIRRVCTRILS